MNVPIESVMKRAEADAKSRGYYLTPDPKFLNDLLEGLKKNEERYGYPSCPCRPATGIYELDRDIICPCDYRDPDVLEFGCCYCCLFLDKKTYDSGDMKPIPERRLMEKILSEIETSETEIKPTDVKPDMKNSKQLWYCKQCGYVVFREEPPYICPICRAKKEFFTDIKLEIQIKKT